MLLSFTEWLFLWDLGFVDLVRGLKIKISQKLHRCDLYASKKSVNVLKKINELEQQPAAVPQINGRGQKIAASEDERGNGRRKKRNLEHQTLAFLASIRNI